MLKVLKVLSLFEKTFPKNFQRLRTKNYQIFEVKLREFLMLLESLSSKRIILINDNQVAIAIFYYFDSNKSKIKIESLIFTLLFPCYFHI